MKAERSKKARGKKGGAREDFRKPARAPAAGFRKPARGAPPAYARPPRRGADEAGDPYQPAHRPKLGVAPRLPGRERGGFSGRGFTVTLDPDVARVFRGEASVNRALRLVLQLMQVVQGPRPAPSAPGGRGYAPGAAPRAFAPRPRFDEDDAEDSAAEK